MRYFSPNTAAVSIVRQACSLATVLFASICVPHANASAHGSDVGTRATAIWRVQSFDFYHSSSVAYSCPALAQKIALILEAVGAHRSPRVSIECRGGVQRTARVHITLASPVEATPESVRRAASFDGRAELVARMHDISLPTAAQIERFPATWRNVAIGRSAPLRLDAGDCDLLRGIVKRVLPKLATHVRRRPSCIAGVTRPLSLEIEALMRDQ